MSWTFMWQFVSRDEFKPCTNTIMDFDGGMAHVKF